MARWRKALRWTKRIALGVIAFVVFAIAVTIGTLHTSWGRERVRRIAEDQLQSSFPGSTIRTIDGSVFGDLYARDVVIMGRDKRPLVTVKTVKLEAAISPLVGKTVRVESIKAEDVVVYVHDRGPAPPEKPSTSSGSSEPSSWSIELPVIEVAGGRVEIARPTGTEIIDNLAAHVSLSMRSGEPLLAWVNGSAAFRAEPISVSAIAMYGERLTVPFASVSLGPARVVAANATIDGTKIGGDIAAFAPKALVEKLANVELPGDASVLVHAAPTGHVSLQAFVGDNRADVLAHVDLDTLKAHAIVTATVPDLGAVVPVAEGEQRLVGAGTVVATIVADPEHVDGIVAIDGDAEGYAGTAIVGVDASLERATVVVAAKSVEPPSRQGHQDVSSQTLASWRLGGSFSLEHANDVWSLRDSVVAASAAPRDGGEVTASLTAKGTLSPEPRLAVDGVVDGNRVRYDDLSIARAHARFSATEIPARPTGSVEVEIAGTRRGTLRIPLVALAAHGIMHEDSTIDIDLDRHRVRTADGQAWGGNGGHVRVTEQSIAVTRFASGSGAARVTAQAQIGRTSDALIAKLTARDISVATYDPTLQGTIAADVDVSRKGGSWKGTVDVHASHVVLPKRPVFDGKLAIKIDKRRVTATATASNPDIGSATVDLDVVGPRDITDALAWQRLERSSIQRIRVALSQIDASKLGASGNLDGELAIGAIDAGGKVDVKGVVTDVGTLDSQLALAPGPGGEIAAHGRLHLGGIDPVDINAVLALPIHPFDPAGWKQLGRATLREATIEAKRLAFDPELMKRFGVDSPWRGWAAVKLTVGPGARSSDFVVDVHELRDGPLAKPLEVHIAGGSDANGPHVDATVTSDKVTMSVTAKSPLSIESMIAGNARTAPIEVTVNVPKQAARDIGLLVGRDDVLAGMLSGTVTIGGTIDEPTGRAVLAIENLSVAAGIASKPPTLEKLALDGRWNGTKQGFEFELTGFETGGRSMKISARGKPAQPETIVATIEAASFDIQPFLAFAPPGSVALGTRGLVSGVLKLKGLDPNTGDVKGRLVVTNARFPIAAELGTFRSGTFEIDVLKKEIVTKIDGKIGRGTVKGKATLRLTGSMPTAAELSLALRGVSLIGEIQPVIDADVSGWFARTKTKWYGEIKVANGNVFVPPESGNELLITGTPSDIIFLDDHKIIVKPKRRPPTKPWLVAKVAVGRTKILVDDLNFKFDGAASGHLQLSVGDGIGLDGELATERGRVEVLGRAYRLDHGVVRFDGSLDPRLDISMAHDFRAMTLTVNILGRSSEPDLRLSADSGSYSQSQLLSFLAGATPSDDPSQQSGDALASGSLTLLSSRVGRRLNKYVPLVKFDTINYEAKTASSSRAIRVGKRIGERTYLDFRNRFEPRPDENAHEAVLQYELGKNVLIEANGGERGAGGDLLWRKRW